MKGVILAGGFGTRLLPLTAVTNKHLLPVFDKPLIYYPIQTLVEAGITEIMIVTGGSWAGDFLQLLGNGKKAFGGHVNLHYTYQDGAGGIPVALSYAKDFVNGEDVCVILGDNVFEKDVAIDFVQSFTKGGRVLLKEVEDPQRFGVAVVTGDKITRIVEKPKELISNLAITGLYCFDSQVWDFIDTLAPSDRGELEVTDLHRYYLQKEELEYKVCSGWWTDAGTFESLYKAATYARSQS